jgi:hypothetical protein
MKELQEINWVKVGVLFLGLGAASYVLFWTFSKLREELRNELGGSEFYYKGKR